MMTGKKRSIQNDSGIYAHHKELDEALCPICIEHPHNAVLLLCSSHGKGCRPYVCDTSYRHSNCLDRYRKVKMDCDTSPPIDRQNPNNTPERSGGLSGDDVVEISRSRYSSGRSSMNPDIQPENFIVDFQSAMARTEEMNLKCPLCRGDVQGWKIVDKARKFLDMKSRSCSSDSCHFVGNYQELRRHARSVHPSVRPAEIDPSREQAWRRFELERENDDVVSAIHSAMPGAVVLGDYALENGSSDMNTTERGSSPVWTPVFLFQMLAEARRRSRGTRSTQRRVSEGSFRERYLNILGLGLADESDDDSNYEVNTLNVNNDEPALRRRRPDEAVVIDVEDESGSRSTHMRGNEASYRRLYLYMLGLGDDRDDANPFNVNNDEPSLRRRRRDEVNVINIDDDVQEDLPVQRRRRLTQMAPNGDEL